MYSNPCHRCCNFEQNFEQLQDRESSLRVKVDSLSQKVNQLSHQKRLLEKQNELLVNTCTLPIYGSKQEEITSQEVENLLVNFDNIFTTQGNDLIRLTNDRNNMYKLLFKSMKIIDYQNDKMQKYSNVITTLLSVTPPQCLQGTIITQLNQLGIQYSQFLQPRNFDFMSNQELNDKKGTAYVSSLLSQITSMYPQTYQYVSEVSKYLNKKTTEIQELNTQKTELSNKISKICTILNVNENEIDTQITKLITEIKGVKRAYKFAAEIVNVCVSFAEQYCMDDHVNKCVNRLKSWLSCGDKSVNVIQEVDFLLGLCFPLSDNKKFKTDRRDPFMF